MSDEQSSLRRPSSSSSSDGGGREQPNRIKAFIRKNRNNKLSLVVPLFSTLVVSTYFYYLLFVDVGSGVDVRKIKEATAPIFKSSLSDDPITVINLQPRSLADITIANVEVALKYHEYLVQRREDARRKKEKQMEEREEAMRKIRENRKAAAAAAVASRGGKSGINGSDFIASSSLQNQTNLLSKESPSSSNTTTSDADLDYVQKIATPLQRHRMKREKISSSNGDIGFLPFLIMLWICSICRLFARLVIPFGSSSNISSNTEYNEDEDGENDNVADGAFTFLTMGGGRDAMLLRRRIRTAQASRRFQRFVDRLNAERVENGERVISAETLRHLVNTRDFNGNDYEHLHSFAAENGPAWGSLFSQVGATEAEINRSSLR